MKNSYRNLSLLALTLVFLSSTTVEARVKKQRGKRVSVSLSVDQSAKPKRMSNRDKQRERAAHGLKRTYDAIIVDCSEILKSYDALISAAPAEYAYYLNQLTRTITKEVELEHIPLYSNALSEFFRSWGLDDYQRSKEKHQSPLKYFKNRLLPEAIKALEVRQRFVNGCDIDAPVNRLLEKLRDMGRII